jgi:uncharacterized small protein (DUF1192 family)
MAMATPDDEPPKKKASAHEVGEELAKLSLDELAARVEILKKEIARIEATIAAKRASASAAETFFRR